MQGELHFDCEPFSVIKFSAIRFSVIRFSVQVFCYQVRGNVARSRHAQWWLGNKVKISDSKGKKYRAELKTSVWQFTNFQRREKGLKVVI